LLNAKRLPALRMYKIELPADENAVQRGANGCDRKVAR
jgi:hypothetical protein